MEAQDTWNKSTVREGAYKFSCTCYHSSTVQEEGIFAEGRVKVSQQTSHEDAANSSYWEVYHAPRLATHLGKQSKICTVESHTIFPPFLQGAVTGAILGSEIGVWTNRELREACYSHVWASTNILLHCIGFSCLANSAWLSRITII